MPNSTKHTNDEMTVRCPVEGCEKELLSRGLHLHVRQSDGGGHGENGSVPDDVDLDKAQPVGEREVQMDYPHERETENVERLCPYCNQTWSGKEGVMIHLGQKAGRDNHPEDPKRIHDATDFDIVHVDDDGNVIETVDSGAKMPSTERRENNGGRSEEEIREYIDGLREQGLYEQAEQAESMLL